MTLALAVLGGMLVVGGIVLIVATFAGALDGVDPSPRSTGLWTTSVERLVHLSVRDRWMLLVAAVAGVGAYLWTGWVTLLVIVPVAVLGIPHLLSSPKQTEIELLQALDRWVRGMAATMSTGRSITDALRLSARQAPALLAPHLVLLLRRIDDRWPPSQALLGMADDLDSADADAVIASLVLATERGGTGAVATLAALADSIQERLKALREIEAERAKPRTVVRQVTGITMVVLAVAMVFGRDFLAPYATPVGQVVLVCLVSAYVGSLVMLRRMTLPRHRARILRSQA